MYYQLWSESIGPDGILVRYFLIPNFADAYLIGDDGSVWSRYKGSGPGTYLSDDWSLRIATPTDGYMYIALSLNGVSHTKTIHQLVCEAVNGPCPAGQEVCHNDGNRANNSWRNLRYDTHINNHADQIIHGTVIRGEKKYSARLNRGKAREIRVKYASGKYGMRDLAREYGVSISTIHDIVNNLTWIDERLDAV